MRNTDTATVEAIAPAWMRHAACAGHPAPLWDLHAASDDADPDPMESRSLRRLRHRAAVEYCSACLVAVECAEYAQQYGEEGVWGGLLFRGRTAPVQVRRQA